VNAKERLIVALDVQPAEAHRLVAELRDEVGLFKIGSQLFTLVGPQFVREIVDSGCQVFLDLKFHDIPHQVSGAATAVTKLGVSMFTVHSSGGSEMMRRATEAVAETVQREGLTRPKILAVSVLTSMDANALTEIGMLSSPAETVLRLVKLAEASGVDGVVASPEETRSIRSTAQRKELLIVTPGIRPGATSNDDQKRIATPAAAIAAGADYLVVGRPITGATNPLAAARAMIKEMAISAVA
jgi:orotidine-5'-phosphate decarboxylase